MTNSRHVAGEDSGSGSPDSLHESKNLPPRRYPGPSDRSAIGLPASLTPSVARRHNLPMQLSSFIGREREVDEVGWLLDTARLVTLTGPGGTGKTRLALRAAAGRVERYTDGVWLVELAPLADPALVPQTVARALGVREQPGRSLISTLSDHLGFDELLLVLDNCEHLLDACGRITEALLAACPELQVLVTSREALHVAGELVWHVPPLRLPGTRHSSEEEGAAQSEAVRLFLERARPRLPAVDPGSKDARTVVEICSRLGGLPLAIELAASKVGLLSLEQIAARLDDSLRLLTDSSRALPRQQTMRATLDWSYNLLSEQERRLLARISVFVGGCSLEAAEAVAGGDGVEADTVAHLLSRLVEKSRISTGVTAEGVVRYSMLELIRQHARERLEEIGEAGAALRRHAEWYTALAEQAEPELNGPQQAEWLDRLGGEHDNLRAVLGWTLGRPGGVPAEQGLGLRLAVALWRFWYTRGYLSEGRSWLETALLAGEGASVSVRATALNRAGSLAWAQGDYEKAVPFLEASRELFQQLEDRSGVASALNNLGLVALYRGDYDRAAPLFEESVALRRTMEDRRDLPITLTNVGVVTFYRGEYERAARVFEESLALFRLVGNGWGEALSLTNLGRTALEQGDHARAAPVLKESLELGRSLGERRDIAECLEALAAVAGAQGQPACAARLWGAAEVLREAVGAPLTVADRVLYERHLALARSVLGEAAFASGLEEGRAMTLEQALDTALSFQPF